MMRFVIICVISLVYSQAVGQDNFKPLSNTDGLKEGVKDMAAKTTSIATSFKQEKHVSILNNPLKAEGKMYFKKPNRLKWEYTVPYDYAIIFNAESITINDDGKVSNFDLSSSKSFMEINQIIVNSVSGNILQEEQFEIQYLSSPKYYLAKMKPKAEQLKSYIAVIEVFIDKMDFTVAKIKLSEKGGDYTLIDFFDKSLNADISDEIFQER